MFHQCFKDIRVVESRFGVLIVEFYSFSIETYFREHYARERSKYRSTTTDVEVFVINSYFHPAAAPL
jgi:hypothetical protein